MPIDFRRNQTEHSQAEIANIEQLAYTLLETARMRCERLRAVPEPDSELELIHRDLGLAGYHCCAQMGNDTRQRCLEIAREECLVSQREDDFDRTLEMMFEESVAASDTLSEVLADSSSDHMHIAHVYVMSASESLDEYMMLRTA